jgi:hypothetical protein
MGVRRLMIRDIVVGRRFLPGRAPNRSLSRVLPLAVAIIAAMCATTVAEARETRSHAVCSARVNALVDTLTELEGRVAVGLNFRQYKEQVSRVRVAYARVNWRRTETACVLYVGAPAIRAMNAYLRGYNSWAICIQRLTCNSPASDATIQRAWRNAAANVDRAVNNLD